MFSGDFVFVILLPVRVYWGGNNDCQGGEMSLANTGSLGNWNITGTTTAYVECCKCGRNLSHATSVVYISEGPICTFCLAKLKRED